MTSEKLTTYEKQDKLHKVWILQSDAGVKTNREPIEVVEIVKVSRLTEIS